ncbi:MAG: caspase family protein [Waterburya sp.]
MTQANSSPDLYALLIGINCYLPNLLSDGSHYGSLDGAVGDIEDVEKFLLRQPQKPKQIFKLTATSSETSSFSDPPKPIESEEQLPTYANIIKHFDEITKVAREGDLVYVHYSGHGGRAKSIYPKEIKSNGIDEALVPTDIGTGEGQYIRDLELAVLLKRMVDKGLVVTLILDSCHSGGSTRGGDAKIRGLRHDVIDETPRPTASLVNPSAEELAAVAPGWKNLKYATRAGIPVATMIPEAKGYVLLAACRPSEYAYEYPFDGQQSNGALTYWLLDTLAQPNPGITYKMIHDRINGKINTQFPTQNPMILGEGDRTFLGKEYKSVPFAVNVLEVKSEENKVKLGAGQAQGLRKGAEFAIYPSGTLDFADKTQRIALAEITKRGAAESWAEITTVINDQIAIQEGSQAVLTSVPVKLLKKVRLLKDKDTPPGRESALKAIETAIQDNGWVKLVAEDADNPEAADYQVDVKAVNEEEANKYRLTVGEVIYEVCDRTGAPIILRPAIKVDASGAAAKIVKRLVHLAKYQATEELDNHDLNSELKGQIAVEILGKQDDYERGDPIDPKPFADPDNPTLNVDEYLFIKIRNNYSEVLNFTILDLESNWAISQIEPSKATSQFTPLDPGEDKLIILRMSLPEGDKEGLDIFKVFATKDAANFRWLALPALDQPFLSKAERGITRSAFNPLEELLSSFAAEHPTRTGNPVAFPSNDWTTTQITINVNQ